MELCTGLGMIRMMRIPSLLFYVSLVVPILVRVYLEVGIDYRTY